MFMKSNLKIMFGVFAFLALLSTVYAEPIISDLKLDLITKENENNYSFNILLKVKEELTKADIEYIITDHSENFKIHDNGSLDKYKSDCNEKNMTCKITIDGLDLSEIEEGPVLFSVSINDGENKDNFEKYTAKGFSIEITGNTINSSSEDYVIYGIINTPGVDLNSDSSNININIPGINSSAVSCKVDDGCPLRSSIPANETPANSPDAHIERNFCCYLSNSIEDATYSGINVTYEIPKINDILANIILKNKSDFDFTIDRIPPKVSVDKLDIESSVLSGTITEKNLKDFNITVNGKLYEKSDIVIEKNNENKKNWSVNLKSSFSDSNFYDVQYIATDIAGGKEEDNKPLLKLQISPNKNNNHFVVNKNQFNLNVSIYSLDSDIFDKSKLCLEIRPIKLKTVIDTYTCNYAVHNNNIITYACNLYDLNDDTYDIDIVYSSSTTSSFNLKERIKLTVDNTPPVVTVDKLDVESSELSGTITEKNLRCLAINVGGSLYINGCNGNQNNVPDKINVADGKWWIVLDESSYKNNLDIKLFATDDAGNKKQQDLSTLKLQIKPLSYKTIINDRFVNSDNNFSFAGSIDVNLSILGLDSLDNDLLNNLKIEIKPIKSETVSKSEPKCKIVKFDKSKIDFSCELHDLVDDRFDVDFIYSLKSIVLRESIKTTIDTKSPDVIVYPLTTTDTNPVLKGNIKDNLTGVDSFVITVGGKNYNVTETDIDSDGNWSVQLNNLTVGNHQVTYVATDKAGNETRETVDAVTRNATYATGTRVYSTTTITTEPVSPAPLPVIPVEQTVVTEPTVVNVPAPTPTPTTGTTVTETPSELSPITGNVAAANPEESSSTTGFLGLSSGVSKSVAITIGVLLVIGTIGYFVLFYKK